VSHSYFFLLKFSLLTEPSTDARSLLPTLSEVVQSGIRVLLWAGDADWNCNWFGGFSVANSISYEHSTAFQEAEVRNYTLNGVPGGTYKTKGNLSWLRVFESGHYVPFYREL